MPTARSRSNHQPPALVDQHRVDVRATPERVFRTVCRIGGLGRADGLCSLLWGIRGWLDRLAGGPGLRRGRPAPELVAPGKPLDFWTVTRCEPDRRLELEAGMRLPGRARLDYAIEARREAPDATRLTQTLTFRPSGFMGLAYWYAVWPLHHLVFRLMIAELRREAERPEAPRGRPSSRADIAPRDTLGSAHGPREPRV